MKSPSREERALCPACNVGSPVRRPGRQCDASPHPAATQRAELQSFPRTVSIFPLFKNNDFFGSTNSNDIKTLEKLSVSVEC